MWCDLDQHSSKRYNDDRYYDWSSYSPRRCSSNESTKQILGTTFTTTFVSTIIIDLEHVSSKDAGSSLYPLKHGENNQAQNIIDHRSLELASAPKADNTSKQTTAMRLPSGLLSSFSCCKTLVAMPIEVLLLVRKNHRCALASIGPSQPPMLPVRPCQAQSSDHNLRGQAAWCQSQRSNHRSIGANTTAYH